MAETLIFPAQEIVGLMADGLIIQPHLFELNEGETYRVVWNDVSYECVCHTQSELFPGVPVVGDVRIEEGTATTPFLLAYLSEEASAEIGESGSATLMIGVILTDDGGWEGDFAETHTLAVYKITDEPDEQDGIILRDYKGEETVERGVEGILLDTTDGGTKLFVDADTVPETVEQTVELDFSGGDVEVTPAEGQAFSKVTVPVPGNLLPENIAEGVSIAGIIGTLVAGGGGAAPVCKTGYFVPTAASTGYTVTHGLGVVPDIVVVIACSKTITATNIVTGAFGLSSALIAKGCEGLICSTTNMLSVITGMEDSTSSMRQYGAIRSANENNFQLGGSTWKLGASIDYEWVAIAGLT